MPKPKYVVKFNETSELYLSGYIGGDAYENAIWQPVEATLVEYDTLEEAQEAAKKINSGTVGTIKP